MAPNLKTVGSRSRLVLAWMGALMLIAPSAFGAPGFMRAGDMAAERASFPAVALPDGKVFVASGDSAEVFDSATTLFGSAEPSSVAGEVASQARSLPTVMSFSREG